MASEASRAALLAAQQNLTWQVRERLVSYAEQLWGGLGSWRDDDIDRFVDLIAPKVIAGQRRIADLTDAYIAQVVGGVPAGGIDVTDLRGLPTDEVYRRPAKTLYNELSGGKPFAAAMATATARLLNLVATDLQMAKVRQARHTMTARGVPAFRRVLRGRGDCALCIVASTQRYWRGNLLPIHPACDCDIEPLGRGDHFEQVLDPDQLDAVHAKVSGFTGDYDLGARNPDYRKLIVVRDHGEIGPLLSWKHQRFTGPADIG